MLIVYGLLHTDTALCDHIRVHRRLCHRPTSFWSSIALRAFRSVLSAAL